MIPSFPIDDNTPVPEELCLMVPSSHPMAGQPGFRVYPKLDELDSSGESPRREPMLLRIVKCLLGKALDHIELVRWRRRQQPYSWHAWNLSVWKKRINERYPRPAFPDCMYRGKS